MAEAAEMPAPSGYQISPRRMCDLPAGERPRELFARVGPGNMTDAQLLALLLRSGIRGSSVIELAEQLLQQHGSLTAMAELSADDLRRCKGVGPVKAQIVKAALELARRMTQERLPAAVIVRTPEEAARLVRDEARQETQEVFWVLLLDTRYRLRRPPQVVTRGILDASLVHPREVFKEAIRSSSAAVVLVHNHPSGDPSPSAEDIRITRQLVEAGRVMQIEVLDHVIVGRAGAGQSADFVSLREAGLVAFK